MNQSTIRRAFLIGVPILLAIGLGVWLIPKPEAECPITPATEQDFREAMRPGARVFEVDGWRADSLEHQALISAGWFDENSEAFAHSQLLLYNCGYTDVEIKEFYGEEGMTVMYGGYDSWEQTATCEAAGLTLYEFDLVLDGRPFKSRMWVEPVSETRVRDMRIDFPTGDTRIDEYAGRLYPQLVSCEG